jgi:hypothetical protein
MKTTDSERLRFGGVRYAEETIRQLAQSRRELAARRSQIVCLYCREIITLNPDGEEARANGTDPYQQMRKHLAAHGAGSLADMHARRCGFLIDMLAFDGVNRPENWRKQIAEMVEFLLTEHIALVPRPREAQER